MKIFGSTLLQPARSVCISPSAFFIGFVKRIKTISPLLNTSLSGVFRGGPCARAPPFGRTAVSFVTILGLFLAPFRDKIAATSDQMRFFWRKML